MTIPHSSIISLEFLRLLEDNKVRTMKQVVKELSEILNLNKEDQTKMKKSGNGTVFDNRVNWMKYHLKQAGFVISPKKGQVKITNGGIKILKKKNIIIDRLFLKNYDNK